MKEQEQALLSVRKSAKETEEEMSERIRELESQLESKDIELRDLKWEWEDKQREWSAKILRSAAHLNIHRFPLCVNFCFQLTR